MKQTIEEVKKEREKWYTAYLEASGKNHDLIIQNKCLGEGIDVLTKKNKELLRDVYSLIFFLLMSLIALVGVAFSCL